MKIDHEVELRPSHLLHELNDPPDRDELVPITQRDAIDFKDLVRITRQRNDFIRRFTDRNRDPRIRKTLPNRAQRRQAQHNIAELPEIDYENIAWIKSHVSKRLFQLSQIAAGHLYRLFHVVHREDRRRDVFERTAAAEL